MQLASESTVQVSDEVLSQDVQGELVLLDMASESYFGLNAVGSRAWALLSAGHTFGEAVERMLGEFETDRDTLVSDLTRLVRQLEEAGLVTVRN